jgi:hypothetical protein
MELAIPDQAWPVVLLVAVVIVALLVALVLLLITLWSRGRSRVGSQPATDFERSDVAEVKPLVGAPSLSRAPEGQASVQPLKPPGEEAADASVAPAAVGDSPSDAGQRPPAAPGTSEPIGAGHETSPSVEWRAWEPSSTPGSQNEAPPKPPSYQPASESLVQRLQQHPALAMGVALVAGWLLKSILRRR